MSDYLDSAKTALLDGDMWAAAANALVGLLDSVESQAEQESREDFLRGKWDECDSALGRVLELAETLDAHPHATLKPSAFADLASRIRGAIDGEEAV